MSFKVKGLAWQQQDTAVSACATIALWTMLHSSAFDDHHAIPTTADITRYAHRSFSFGRRTFPSKGLNIMQTCEAITESGLEPVICQGDIEKQDNVVGFSRARFCSVTASLIRSGYPVLLTGKLERHGHHAICAVGFRECAPPIPRPRQVELQDQGVSYFYVHDDNIGPNVRLKVHENRSTRAVELIPSATDTGRSVSQGDDPVASYPKFSPNYIIAAVHSDLRTHPDAIHYAGLKTAKILCNSLNRGRLRMGLTMSSRLIKLHKYVGEELGQMLDGNPTLLAKIRFALCESVPPMSLHIGVVRIGWGPVPLLDILYDTTDSDRNIYSFGHVAYDPVISEIVSALMDQISLPLGTQVKGH
jgi:hypothetical protein